MKHLFLIFAVIFYSVSFAANVNFCRTDGTKLEYAPNFIWPSWETPSAADYLAQGWLYNRVTPAPYIDGKVSRLDRYEVQGDDVVAVYAYDDAPTPVVRYSKLKLIVAAKKHGKWDAFKRFIAASGLEDEWAACQFLSSDYAQFAEAKAAIVAAGVATEAEIETILSEAVDND